MMGEVREVGDVRCDVEGEGGVVVEEEVKSHGLVSSGNLNF